MMRAEIGEAAGRADQSRRHDGLFATMNVSTQILLLVLLATAVAILAFGAAMVVSS